MQIPKSYDEMYEQAIELIRRELDGSGIGCYLADKPHDPDTNSHLELLDPDGNLMTIEILFILRPAKDPYASS